MWSRLLRVRSVLPQLAVAPFAFGTGTIARCGKHDEVQRHKEAADRCQQFKEAIAWCRSFDTPKGGYAGSHRLDDDGGWYWPLVTEGSLNRRLKGQVDNEHPFSAHSVLTPQEDSDLVETCKELNEHGQGIDREQLGKMVYDSIFLRSTLNAGRDYAPLSANARAILDAGEVGLRFFTHFFADHPDLTEKRPSSEEILRAKWMTRAVSASHFEKLKATLNRAGLLDDDGKITDPRRVLNSDECPNPWRGTGHRGKIVAAVGKPCVKLVTAAREHTSLDVLIGLDGHLYDAHLIFKGEYVQRQMIPDKSKLSNSKISATTKGYQTGSTLLEVLKHWDKNLTARGVPKPVVWTTDGHASRLNTDVLRWCRENSWIMYLSPPHTTGIHQSLDQIFSTWHKTFNAIVKRWSDENTGKELNKIIFTSMFAEAWGKWTSPTKIVGAFHRVGISVSGLDPAAVKQESFVLSETVVKKKEAAPEPLLPAPQTPGLLAGPSNEPPAEAATDDTVLPATRASINFAEEWQSPSPPSGQYPKDSKEYWQEKQRLTSMQGRELFAVAKGMHETPLTLKASHPSWQVKKASPLRDEDPARRKQRVKGKWGDMDQNEMLEHLEEQENEEEEKKVALAEKRAEREERKRERSVLESEKKEAKTASIELERPVTELLASLGFTDASSVQASAGELTAFARANRTTLLELSIDLTSLTRKDLMPRLQEAKINMFTPAQWHKAQPKALPAPRTTEALAAAPAQGALLAICGPAAPAVAPEQVEAAAPAPAKRARSSARLQDDK